MCTCVTVCSAISTYVCIGAEKFECGRHLVVDLGFPRVHHAAQASPGRDDHTVTTERQETNYLKLDLLTFKLSKLTVSISYRNFRCFLQAHGFSYGTKRCGGRQEEIDPRQDTLSDCHLETLHARLQLARAHHTIAVSPFVRCAAIRTFPTMAYPQTLCSSLAHGTEDWRVPSPQRWEAHNTTHPPTHKFLL